MGFIEKIQAALRVREVTPVDPTIFNDPVALKTEWLPQSKGGASFGTHELVAISRSRLEFRANLKGRAFALVFVVVGACCLLGSALAIFQGGRFLPALIVMIPVGSLFTAIGGLIYYTLCTPFVFDKSLGFFFKKCKEQIAQERMVRPDRNDPNTGLLSEIHALQLIREHVVSSSSSGRGGSNYNSFELNLVLSDGRRVNVVDHGNVELLRQNAAELAAFLGRPIWDAASS